MFQSLTYECRGGVEFFLGSAVRGKILTGAADALDTQRTKNAHNMFYSRLPAFVENQEGAKKLDYQITEDTDIFYFGNEGGQRVYFIMLPQIRVVERKLFNPFVTETLEAPCIVKIAVCDKNLEQQVLGVLTKQSKRRLGLILRDK